MKGRKGGKPPKFRLFRPWSQNSSHRSGHARCPLSFPRPLGMEWDDRDGERSPQGLSNGGSCSLPAVTFTRGLAWT